MKRIGWKEFEKFLLYIGCTFERQKGDHLIYHKDGLKRPLVIRRVKDLPNFIINNNLRTLNMTREEFEEIMDRL